MTPEASVHLRLGRIEAIDREVALPSGWFFRDDRGHWVASNVGRATAQRLKAQCVRLPDPDARVLLRRADRSYVFDDTMDDPTSWRWFPTPKAGSHCRLMRSRWPSR
jgi:hypothetical protein